MEGLSSHSALWFVFSANCGCWARDWLRKILSLSRQERMHDSSSDGVPGTVISDSVF